jgi:hypothetical protein
MPDRTSKTRLSSGRHLPTLAEVSVDLARLSIDSRSAGSAGTVLTEDWRQVKR